MDDKMFKHCNKYMYSDPEAGVIGSVVGEED